MTKSEPSGIGTVLPSQAGLTEPIRSGPLVLTLKAGAAAPGALAVTVSPADQLGVVHWKVG